MWFSEPTLFFYATVDYCTRPLRALDLSHSCVTLTLQVGGGRSGSREGRGHQQGEQSLSRVGVVLLL